MVCQTPEAHYEGMIISEDLRREVKKSALHDFTVKAIL